MYCALCIAYHSIPCNLKYSHTKHRWWYFRFSYFSYSVNWTTRRNIHQSTLHNFANQNLNSKKISYHTFVNNTSIQLTHWRISVHFQRLNFIKQIKWRAIQIGVYWQYHVLVISNHIINSRWNRVRIVLDDLQHMQFQFHRWNVAVIIAIYLYKMDMFGLLIM